MRTRWSFFRGLDGRYGLRVWAFRRMGRRWEIVSRLLVPAIHETRPLALEGLLAAVAEGMPSVLTLPELKGAVPLYWKGVMGWL
jgi:hypothetical protein